ncbi:MAG: trypsin-like peptidase domain-containing protein [Anaerolineales bacterium]|nr:trypsin-like peptidase domain-containing protein [Chloroflexota bacterium]MBL6980807.1 trypsin-like peptidase domain-containing protein [Anaerolineales bacterium]
MSKGKNVFVEISKAMADAVNNAGNSVVLVNARRRRPSSGIVYAPDLVLTAEHAVERDENISVVLSDGQEVPVEVAGRDPGSDLALLKLTEAKLTPAETTPSEPSVGELVLALGRPTPSGVEASLGVVSGVDGPAHSRRGMIDRFIRTDAIPLPGFSGGALINAEGLILGINTSGLSHGMLLSIPSSIAWKTAQSLAEHGSIKRGYLGVQSQYVELPSASQEALGREQSSGLLLTHIEEGSPSADGDLMVGDIIVGVAGSPVPNHDTLLVKLSGDVVGKSTPIEILRGGQPQSADVVIGERKQRQKGKGKHKRGGRGHQRHHRSHRP